MHTMRTRIARLTATSVVALGLGALAAGPALAADASPDGLGRPGGIQSVIILGEDASPDGIGKPGGVQSVIIFAEDASPDGFGRGGGVSSVEDGAGSEWYLSAGDDASPDGIGRPSGVS